MARTQVTLLPECVHDYLNDENPVRVVNVFYELDLVELGLAGVDPAATGRQTLPSSSAEDLHQ